MLRMVRVRSLELPSVQPDIRVSSVRNVLVCCTHASVVNYSTQGKQRGIGSIASCRLDRISAFNVLFRKI